MTCSRDPIGFEGSRWSLYEYVDSTPLVNLDPTGQVIDTIVDVCGIGYDAVAFCKEPSWGNAGCFCWSVGATFVPCVPGSWAGRGGKAIFTKGDEVVEAAAKGKRRTPQKSKGSTSDAPNGGGKKSGGDSDAGSKKKDRKEEKKKKSMWKCTTKPRGFCPSQCQTPFVGYGATEAEAKLASEAACSAAGCHTPRGTEGDINYKCDCGHTTCQPPK